MRRVLSLSAGLIAVVVVAVSCKEPTQIVVEAHTNVAFEPGMVTAFTVGSPGQTEKADPTTETGEPWSGSLIGTLVVVPGGADDAQLAVKIVLGVSRGARECVAPTYEGCIVARRRLRYVPNERLRLPITLYAQCENVPCDELSTCSVLGQCVPVEALCTDDGTCALPDEPVPDGGVIAPPPDATEASATDVATIDGGDANLDSSSDARDAAMPADASGSGVILCRGAPNDVCPYPLRCCADPEGLPAGVCVDELTSCPMTTSREIQCDGPEDCGGKQCCLTDEPGAFAYCRTEGCAPTDTELCTLGTCVVGTCSNTLAFQAYRTCQ